ncbi:flavin reductase family protein [Thermoleophilia bacterium SCSIO 60948]|nr:flavin reductase family protein [Thermoleophilia bacterium SCSIO 60948]
MSQRAFRDAMGRFPTGVAVVSSRQGDGALRATTVNALSSVSLEPPTVLVCLDLASFTLAAVRDSKRFAINVLAEDHRDLSDHFAVRGSPAEEVDAWVDPEHPTPLVRGAVAHVECELERVIESGDHAIVLGAVVALADDGGRATPLTFLGGSYARVVRAEPVGAAGA